MVIWQKTVLQEMEMEKNRRKIFFNEIIESSIVFFLYRDSKKKPEASGRKLTTFELVS